MAKLYFDDPEIEHYERSNASWRHAATAKAATELMRGALAKLAIR